MAMNILEIIEELHNKGLNDNDIAMRLRSQGYTKQEINDAMTQFKAKLAVGGGNISEESKLQPSIMEQETTQATQEIPIPTPTTKKGYKKPEKVQEYVETRPQEAKYPYKPITQQYETVSTELQPQATQTYPTDIETIEEITEEIVAEKFSEVKTKLDNIFSFKEIIENRVKNIEERIKRIESSLDKLQAAFIGKVNEFDKDIKNLGSEMRAVHGAFSKILDPLVDNVKELGRITEKIKEENNNSN